MKNVFRKFTIYLCLVSVLFGEFSTVAFAGTLVPASSVPPIIPPTPANTVNFTQASDGVLNNKDLSTTLITPQEFQEQEAAVASAEKEIAQTEKSVSAAPKKSGTFVSRTQERALTHLNKYPIYAKILPGVAMGIIGVMVGDVTRRMNEAHLKMISEDVDKATTEVVAQWKVGTLESFIAGSGFSYAIGWALSNIPSGFWRGMISGTLFSGVSAVLGDLISASADFTLRNPTLFKDGISQQEASAIQNLVQRTGYSFALGTLPNAPSSIRSAYRKVWRVFYYTLTKREELRTSLYSHIFNEAMTGGTLSQLGLNITSTLITNKILGPGSLKELGFKAYTARAWGISLAVFAAGSLLPDPAEDEITAKVRRGYEGLIYKDQYARDTWPIISINSSLTSWENNLSGRIKRRELMLDKELSLLRTAFTRINYYTMELHYLDKVRVEYPQVLQEKLDRYNKVTGKHDVITPEALQRIQNDSSLSYKYTLWAVDFYQNMYETAAQNMIQIYNEEYSRLEKFAIQMPEGPIKDKIKDNAERAAKMFSFIHQFTNNLRPGMFLGARRPDTLALGSNFQKAYSVLEKTGFWRLRESDVLR